MRDECFPDLEELGRELQDPAALVAERFLLPAIYSEGTVFTPIGAGETHLMQPVSPNVRLLSDVVRVDPIE